MSNSNQNSGGKSGPPGPNGKHPAAKGSGLGFRRSPEEWRKYLTDTELADLRRADRVITELNTEIKDLKKSMESKVRRQLAYLQVWRKLRDTGARRQKEKMSNELGPARSGKSGTWIRSGNQVILPGF
jgi:hypothetical protein